METATNASTAPEDALGRTGRKSLTISDIEALKELGFVLIRRYDSERL
jgi:hypothetical protein